MLIPQPLPGCRCFLLGNLFSGHGVVSSHGGSEVSYLGCQPQEFTAVGSPEAAGRWPREKCEVEQQEGRGSQKLLFWSGVCGVALLCLN